MASNRPKTPGYIHVAGRTGMVPERPRRGQRWPNWASRQPVTILHDAHSTKSEAVRQRRELFESPAPAPKTRSRQRTRPKPSCCGLQPTSGSSATTCNGSFRSVRATRMRRVPVGGHAISAEAARVCSWCWYGCLVKMVFRRMSSVRSARCPNGISLDFTHGDRAAGPRRGPRGGRRIASLN
jgi:hypothetical protein